MQGLLAKSLLRTVFLKKIRDGNIRHVAVLTNKGSELRRYSSQNSVKSLLPTHDEFSIRHIGPRDYDQKEMLDFLGYKVRLRLFK